MFPVRKHSTLTKRPYVTLGACVIGQFGRPSWGKAEIASELNSMYPWEIVAERSFHSVANVLAQPVKLLTKWE